MTSRANQSLAVGGILLVLAAFAVTQFVERPAEVEVSEDDDSGDDDSGVFDHLAPAPKE